MSTEVGTEAHPIIDNTPNENGLEAWRRLTHGFDPAPAQAHLLTQWEESAHSLCKEDVVSRNARRKEGRELDVDIHVGELSEA